MLTPSYSNKAAGIRTNTLRALQDLWINGGTVLVKKGEIFQSSCKSCVQDMIKNGMVELVEPDPSNQ